MWYNGAMQVICEVDCRDCGEFHLTDKDDACVFVYGNRGQLFVACPFCRRVMVEEIYPSLVAHLLMHGVLVYDISTMEKVEDTVL